MISTLMITKILVTLCFLKAKDFWIKDYDVMISMIDVTNKILSHYPNYIVDVVKQPKFGNSSISMRVVIIT